MSEHFLREAPDWKITAWFEFQFRKDPEKAWKDTLHLRNPRSGLGERRIFRVILRHCGNNHKEFISTRMADIPENGRWDDLFSILGTRSESRMIYFLAEQLAEDEEKVSKGEKPSLLAKWMPSPDTSSERTRRLAHTLTQKLGLTTFEYKRLIRYLRKPLDLTETRMSQGNWNLTYVPYGAQKKYKKALERHGVQKS